MLMILTVVVGGIRDWLSKTQVLEFGDFGDCRRYAYPKGCLSISWLVYCQFGSLFHMCQSPTLLNCFGQVMLTLGII